MYLIDTLPDSDVDDPRDSYLAGLLAGVSLAVLVGRIAVEVISRKTSKAADDGTD